MPGGEKFLGLAETRNTFEQTWKRVFDELHSEAGKKKEYLQNHHGILQSLFHRKQAQMPMPRCQPSKQILSLRQQLSYLKAARFLDKAIEIKETLGILEQSQRKKTEE